MLELRSERAEVPAQAQQAERRVPTLVILSAGPSSETDAIHAYTSRLVASLQLDPRAHVSWRSPRETLVDLQPGESLGGAPPLTVLLQYNPFNFGRWGVAPWLVRRLSRLKRSASCRLALMVHEAYVPIKDWRSALMGGWQRLQLFALRVLADELFVSSDSWASRLEGHRPLRPVHHLPVASNLPDMRAARTSQRQRLGATDETVVLACFGTGHPSRLMDYVAHAVDRVAADNVTTILLNLGAGTPPVETVPAVRVVTPGQLEEAEIAQYLAAADIYLAPFIDGVSTRRTTVMAAMQHGLAIVGTDGRNTDPMLRRATDALWLTRVGDRGGFADAVCELAADAEVRVDRGARSRALYEREFDWSVISDRLLTELYG